VTTAPAGRPEFDVVVLGTGAAGLVAALAAAEAGASVGLFEKADRVGGTTAISGGGCWVPGSAQMAASGIADSRDDALRYLESLSFGHIRPGFAEAFVGDGPRVFQWLESVAGLRMKIVPGYPDYQPERPGGRPGGGRTLEPELFSYRRLGRWAELVWSSHRNPHLMLSDTTLGGGTGSSPGRSRRPGGRCRHPAAGRHGIVRARRGVVLATGGFEWDPELVRSFLRGPMTYPASIPTNVGDGLLIAMRAGAALDNMPQAWWVPVIEIPGDVSFGRQRATLLTGSGRCRARFSSTSSVAASPMRRRTITLSAARCTSWTPPASTTPTCRAGSSSTPNTWPVTASGPCVPQIRPRNG